MKGQEALSFPRIYSRALRGEHGGGRSGKRGDQRNENQQTPNSGKRITHYTPKLHQSQEPWTFAVSKVWKYMYGIHVLKYTRIDQKQALPPLLFIPLVITHEAYVSVGHVSLKPRKDTIHPCMLNGFI